MSDFNFAELASIGTPVESTPSPTEQKAQTVQESSLMKQALYGSPEEQYEIATNVLLDTELSRQQEIIDLRSMDPLAFAAKYGVEAQRRRGAYAQMEREVRQEGQERQTTGERVQDNAVSFGNALVNMVGSTAQIATAGVDGWRKGAYALTGELDEFEPWAPAVGEATEAVSGAIGELRSETGQRALSRAAYQRQIASEDNAAIRGDDDSFGAAVSEFLANMGDTASITAGSEAATGDLMFQAAGSLVPISAASGAIGRANALRELSRRNIRGEAAEEYLKTEAGQELIKESAERSVPALVAMTEGGAGVSQAQLTVMAMSEEELSESPEYVALREQGQSHEEAQTNLASSAGQQAGLTAIPGALAAGKVSAPFAANPLSAGGRGTIGAVRNTVAETVEEGLQEANTQLASNYALQDSAGLDIDLTDGVAESATMGAMGGAMIAGGLQSPAVAGDLARRTGQVAAGGLKLRSDQIARAEDEASPVGSRAQAEASNSISEAGAALVSSLPTPTQTDPNSPTARDTVAQALFLTPEEETAFSEIFPALSAKRASRESGQITRADLINEFSSVVSNEKATADVRKSAAFSIFETLDEMRAVDADNVVAELNEQGDDTSRGMLAELQEQVRTVESSPVLKKAQEQLADLTPESIGSVIDIALLEDTQADPEARQEEMQRLELLSRINPNAVTSEMLDLALNQSVGGGRGGEMLKKRLELAKALADEFRQVDEAKAQIEAEQEIAVAALSPEQKKTARARKHGTYDIVRQEIQSGGNSSNRLPSLQQHRRLVSDAATSGHVSLAQERLEELHAFAESQINKVAALAASAANGQGRAGAQGFRAYNGTGFFDQKPVWVDASNPSSVAQAKEAEVDARTALALVNALADTYGLEIPAALKLTPVNVTSTQPTPTQSTTQQTPTETEGDLVESEAQQEPVIDMVESETADARSADLVESETEAERAADLVESEIDAVERRSADLVDTSDDAPTTQAREETPVEPEVEVDEVVSESADTVSEPIEVDQTAPEQSTAQQPEPEQVTETAPEGETAPSTVSAWFASLKDRVIGKRASGGNVLTEAFKPKEGKSLLAAYNGDPEALAQAIESGELVINATDTEVALEQRATLARLIREDMPQMITALTDAMNAMIEKRGWDEELKSGDAGRILGFDNALPLNAIASEVDGRFELDAAVGQAVYMAAVDWLINQGKKGLPRTDDEFVSKMFGMGRNGRVTGEMRSFAQNNIPLQTAVEDIARTMEDLLGLTADPEAPINETQGLFRSFASNALQMLSNSGVIEQSTYEYRVTNPRTNAQDPRTMIGFGITQAARENADLEAIKTLGKPFSAVLTTEQDDAMFVGVAPKQVNPNQIRNNLGPISKKAEKVIRKLQNAPTYLNTGFIELAERIGDDAFLGLLGYQEVTPDLEAVTNGEDLSSLKGKNISLKRGLDGVREYAQRADDYGAENGIELRDVPIFFGWRLSSVNRLQQQGPITPQGDKIAREMISHTRSTLNLSNETHYKYLWLAIAQSLDISVEKASHADVMGEAMDMVSSGGALYDAVVVVQGMLEDGFYTADDLKAAIAQADVEVTPKLLHALMTVAELNTHEGNEFTTHLALEADGKTDGPVNAMVNMATGSFTPAEIERFAKGGLFFTDQAMPLSEFIQLENEFHKGTKKKGEDLYHLAAAELENSLASDTELMEKSAPLMRVMHALLPDFTLTTENGKSEISVGRNLVKNPLTVFLYGAGERGIANKLTSAMLGELYKTMTEIARGKADGRFRGGIDHPTFAKNPQLVADLAEVFGVSEQDVVTALKDPTSFKVQEEQFKTMSANVLAGFAEPMLSAVNVATGGLVDNMRTLQGAATIQTLVFQDLFAQAQDQKTGEKGTLPSAVDLEDTYIEQMGMAPIYDTDDASYFISKPEKEKLGRNASATFDGKLKSSLTGIRPTDASVKVSPYMTIGMGDGQMMLNIYAKDGDVSFDASLPVFDGVEMPVSEVEGQSSAINGAVWDGWMQANVFRGVSDGFGQMLSRMSPEQWKSLSGETRQEIGRALGLEKGEMPRFEMLQAVKARLEDLAIDQAARKAAMKAVATQVDHMAGAEVPYANAGTSVADGSPLAYTDIAAMLNDLFQTERSRLLAEREGREEYQDAPNPEFEEALQAAGTETSYPGVKALSGKQVVALLGRLNGLTPAKRKILGDVLFSNPEVAETTYYFGTSEALATARDEIVEDNSKTPIQLGLTYTGQGVAFIANQTPETFLHEMLHSATAKAVTSYTANPEAAPENVRFGMEQLNKLMQEVRNMTPETMGLVHLQNELNRLEGRKAEQVLEFIAYMLSNQDLTEFGQKTNSYEIMKRAVKRALSAVKKLLGLRNSDMPNKSIFDQVRFNTKIIALQPNTTAEDLVLNQTADPASRMGGVKARYERRLNQILNARKSAMKGREFASQSADREVVRAEFAKLGLDAKKAAERATAAGFRLNKDQQKAFRAVYVALSTGAKFNPSVMRQIHTIHDQVLEKLTAEDLLNAGAYDMDTAETMLSYMQDGNSNEILPAFMALAETSPLLRKVLAGMKMRPAAKLQTGSFDEAIESVGSAAMSALARMSVSNLGREGTAGRQLDALSWAVSETRMENRIEATVTSISDRVDQANDYAASWVHKFGEKADDLARAGAQSAPNKAVKLGFDAVGFIGALASPERSERRGEGMTMFLNHVNGWNSVRSALNDLRGATSTNIDVMRLINPVKAKIDAIRQDFREGTPKTLAAKFKRRLNSKEWSQLHQGLGVTDLGALGLEGMQALVKNPMTLDQRIAETEEALTNVNAELSGRWQTKAQALAEYMVDGVLTTKHLLRNAEAIGFLFGEKNRPAEDIVTPDVIENIEKLVSLYAYRQLDSDVRNKLAALYASEQEGMDTVTGFLSSVRELERSKKAAEGDAGRIARWNGLQGYIPATGLPDHKVMVAEDSDHGELTMRGWTRIGDYTGQSGDNNTGRRGYYQSSTAGKAAFRQGIAQTVHTTYNGVNVLTGQLMTDNVAGTLRGVRAKRMGENQRRAQPGNADNLAPGEYLIPIFDEKGDVVAYDRHMAPEKVKGLQKDTHLGRMLGVWAGRHFEEEAAHEYNRTLVDTLKSQYQKGLADGRGDEFVNIGDRRLTDPIYKDAWDTLGVAIKEYANDAFGSPNFLPVRKDQIEDAMGYRAASVTDIWTGQSRLPEPAQKVVKDLTTLIMGKNAYPWLRKAEGFVQDAVGVAKTTIIVRSAVVGVGNIVSNVLHLSLKGVPMTTIGKAGREKVLEIQEYVRNMENIQELKIEYTAKVKDPVAARKIEARITAMENANSQMSIAPLIAAGEFSTISEDLSEADVAIREGKIMDYLEQAIDKLPSSAGTVARNLIITKDTALFKGLNRMVQYGDFVAKAVLYDHLKSKGMAEQEVLDTIMEEFVQYNRLPGRGRDYLESMGMLWFMNYALRIMKVLGKTARDRPLSSLMLMGQFGPAAGVDTVFSGSLGGKYLDGSLEFSVGPEMGLNSPSLNPWYNMVQ